MGKKFGDMNPVMDDRKRLDEVIDILTFPKKKWIQIRFLDVDILPVKQHWINILTSKTHKEINIPKFCVSFDPNTEDDLEGIDCPYCSLGSNVAKAQRFYLANAIIRDIQEDEPAKKSKLTPAESESGFKDMDSDSWTPVRVVRLPMSLAKKIKDLGTLNKLKTKSGDVVFYDVSHPSYGADVNIKFDPDETGANMYNVQLSGRTRLTPEEKEYLVYNLTDELLDMCGRETSKEAQKELDRMDLMEKDGDGDSSKASKSTAKSSKSAGKSRGKGPKFQHEEVTAGDDDDYELDGDDEGEDDGDEDEAPPAKTKPKASAKTRSTLAKTAKKRPAKDEDEDEDDSGDEDSSYDDEDDIPF